MSKQRFESVAIREDGFSYFDTRRGVSCSATFPLFLIGQAWAADVNFEDLADGFGEGLGTQGDWSAIRDSSAAAQSCMMERALNHFFPELS